MTDGAREDSDTLLTCYERMYRIRQFENTAEQLYRAGELPGFLHPCVGLEAIPVGLMYGLRDDDMLTSTHRGHGHLIAKGASVDRMFAELFAKETGLCRGRGGSMHMVQASIGVLGANGIVGGGIPIATGAALAAALSGDDRVVFCFFGDGAVNIGAFHEGVNLAAIRKLPVIFVCENNQYAESTRFQDVIATDDLVPRAEGYGIPGEVIDGNDLTACLAAGGRAVERARSGAGPTLLQADTYRWSGHHLGDTAPYRAAEEVEQWRARDPLARTRSKLEQRGPLVRRQLEQTEQTVAEQIAQAVDYARKSPPPAVADVFDDIFAR